ncbi:hypothetical protein KBY96_10000 [Cyanobium sp. ATX 6A2]|uniref:hypothetical protein n=1 Tax=Cyanobium sp. ATX 6A2 TaxID=2823700 RepID=UPI0020CC35F9|nr:hypothetical protein [Cyanobium sp. ATX 6A2]MCP9888256.1 hypothetical protein [Cyanobium sp. ATX 6A2]
MARFAPVLDLHLHLNQARTRILALRNRWRRSPLEPLTLPLVAAVLLNAAGLSLLQMRQNRLVNAQEAPAAEDTQQLLELSDGLEATPDLNSVEVPLPPPPLDLLADAPGDAFPFSTASSTDGSEAVEADPGSAETLAAQPPASGDSAAETQKAASPNSEAPAVDPEAAETTPEGLLILLAQTVNPYDASWETATAEGTPPNELRKLPATLALRSLPVDAARLAGLPVVHGQSVLFDDRLYLLWVKGNTLWMMRAEFGSARAGVGKPE